MRSHLAITFACCVLAACGSRLDGRSPPFVEGDYAAIVFIEPGAADGGVDILDRGGALAASLKPEGKMSGYVRIPPDIGSNYPPMDTVFDGRYATLGDTVHFFQIRPYGSFPLETAEWQPSQRQIESFDRAGHMGSFKVILQKE